MDNPPNQTDLSPVPSQIDFDVPCPKCAYNLRSLTVPRCPECGLTFQWNEIPEFKKAAENKIDLRTKVAVIIGAFFCVILFAILLAPPLILLVVFVLTLFFISAIQAGVEIGFASLVLDYPTWKRFRAWWEGVLIGYGVCSLLLPMWGYCLEFTAPVPSPIPRWKLWPVFLTTGLASLLVQWWVVRRRTRQWNEPIPDRKLWMGCLFAKTVAAVIWIVIPIPIIRFS